MSDKIRRHNYSVTIDYDEATGVILGEYWRNHLGHFDRPADLPAVSIFCRESARLEQLRWHSGQFPNGPHRNGDRPARIVLNPLTNQPIQISFMKAGEFHRDGDEPAYIAKYRDGSLKEQRFWKHGQLHRDLGQGPAVIQYNEQGKIFGVEYWVEGKKIRPTLPIPKLDI